MITSHGYQAMSDDVKLESDLKIVRDIMTDPFGGGSSTGGTPPPVPGVPTGRYTPEDDFDLGPMHMQCMGDEMQGYPHNSYPPPHMMNQQQAHQQAMYQQHHHHHQQMGMQQHWGQQQAYMNGGYYDQYNNYGYGQQMYQQHPQMQQHQQQQTQVPVGMVSGGGPSPGGSHNTPSPQALSESDGDEHNIRNNNVLKRPSPSSDSYGQQHMMQQQQQVGLPHHGHMGPPHRHHPHALPPHVHPHHHHPHVHPHHHMMGGHPSAGLMSSGPPVPKKPKVSKRKKKRDPNEPQKPVSAYALFFRDSQASIKAANPNAAFGDVSKIVASMWDGLDPDSKAAYKKRTENAKKDYLKKLAAYRASLVSKGSGPGDGNIGYGGTFAGFSAFGSESNLIHHGHHPSAKSYLTTPGGNGTVTPVGGVTSASGSPVGGGYLTNQAVPPRPPVQQGPTSHPSQMSGHLGHPHQHQQQQQMHPQHHSGNSYMNMHGQAMQNGMMGSGMQQHQANSHLGHHHPMLPMDHGVSQAQQQQPSGPSSHSPASTASTGSSNTATTSVPPPPTSSATPSTASPSSNSATGGGTTNHKRCGRPGCSNPVQGWTNSEFCSNECVVGQCREVYTHWSSASSGTNNPSMSGQSQQQQQQYTGSNGNSAANRTTTPVK